MPQEENKNEIKNDITELPFETPSSDLVADILLLRTHEFCVTYPVEQQAIVRQQIDSVSQRLAKSIDANDITKLATALQILHNVYNSLHERSVIAFMAQYRPIQNLKLTEKSKEKTKEISEGVEGEISQEITDIGLDGRETQNKTEDDFDINSVYKPYVD